MYFIENSSKSSENVNGNILYNLIMPKRNKNRNLRKVEFSKFSFVYRAGKELFSREIDWSKPRYRMYETTFLLLSRWTLIQTTIKISIVRYFLTLYMLIIKPDNHYIYIKEFFIGGDDKKKTSCTNLKQKRKEWSRTQDEDWYPQLLGEKGQVWWGF